MMHQLAAATDYLLFETFSRAGTMNTGIPTKFVADEITSVVTSPLTMRPATVVRQMWLFELRDGLRRPLVIMSPLQYKKSEGRGAQLDPRKKENNRRR